MEDYLKQTFEDLNKEESITLNEFIEGLEDYLNDMDNENKIIDCGEY